MPGFTMTARQPGATPSPGTVGLVAIRRVVDSFSALWGSQVWKQAKTHERPFLSHTGGHSRTSLGSRWPSPRRGDFRMGNSGDVKIFKSIQGVRKKMSI